MAEKFEISEPDWERIQILVKRIKNVLDPDPIDQYICKKNNPNFFTKSQLRLNLFVVLNHLGNILEFLPKEKIGNLAGIADQALLVAPNFSTSPEHQDLRIDKLTEIARKIFGKVCEILGELGLQIEEARPPSRP
ncbi:MAG: hypothetical protein V1936_03385 [Patescibacteria group bacterium]